MRGPFLPLYGSGAIMMLVVSMPFRGDIILTYVAGCIGATILEYVTGVTMEALFKVRYWDYSNVKFNFQGQICLGSTLAWGVLTILMTEFVHKWVEGVILHIPSHVLTIITYVLTVGIAADFALSFKAALDLRDILVKMERAKEELVRIQKRLDVMMALAGDDISSHRNGFSENMSSRKEAFAENMETRMDDLKQSIEDKMEKFKYIMVTKPEEKILNMRAEYQELHARYDLSVAERSRLSRVKDLVQKDMLRSNPTMTSKKFKEAFEELKNRSREK
jgi:hypothetical protein